MSWPPHFNIHPVPPITYWWIWMPLQWVKTSIGTQTRSGSTIIKTPWHAKIDAHQLFYFVILSVGGTLIDLAVSMKTRLLYTDAHGTLIFDKYEECSSKNHDRACHMEMGATGYNIKLQMLLLCWEVIMEIRINESFQHLYPATAWMNELLWIARVTASTWHHEVDITILFLVLKAAWWQSNTMSSGCGDFCLPACVQGEPN